MITTQINLDHAQPGIIRKYLLHLFITKTLNQTLLFQPLNTPTDNL